MRHTPTQKQGLGQLQAEQVSAGDKTKSFKCKTVVSHVAEAVMLGAMRP